MYTAAYRYRDSSAWHSLSEEEQQRFTAIVEEKELQQNTLWKEQAEDILSSLCATTDMLPCAEDLGAKPSVLPEVLQQLNIFSLRVFRWERQWDIPGSPFIPLQEYPENAVAVTSVHDSSTMRQWWEQELSYSEMCSFFKAVGIDAEMQKHLCPVDGEKPAYTKEVAAAVLNALVKGPSKLALFPIQDWLGLIVDELSEVQAQDERINVPGTVSNINWTYRLPLPIEHLIKHKELVKRLRAITAIR